MYVDIIGADSLNGMLYEAMEAQWGRDEQGLPRAILNNGRIQAGTYSWPYRRIYLHYGNTMPYAMARTTQPSIVPPDNQAQVGNAAAAQSSPQHRTDSDYTEVEDRIHELELYLRQNE